MAEETTPQVDEVAALGTALRSALADVTETIRETNSTLVEEIRAMRPVAEEVATPDPRIVGVSPADRMNDEYDQRWSDPRKSKADNERAVRANLEVAGLVFEGAKRLSRMPIDLQMSDSLRNAYNFHIHENGPRIRIANDQGRIVRAMDTAESGYGQQLVGAEYINDLWMGARNQDGILDSVRTVTMSQNTMYVPVDGQLPEMLYVGENTADNSSPYTASDTPSNRRQFDAKKMTIQQYWSGELSEDSIVAFVPFLREKLSQSVALHLGSAMYNGDTTNAATGNINSDDADPADTRHYLAFDGIRHYWIVDDTGNEVNQNAAITAAAINTARGKLAGANNSVNALNSINWGQDPNQLRIVCDNASYMALLGLSQVVTATNVVAPQTIVTGELGRINGIPIIVPSYATLTEADGKLSATASNNSKGQITVFNTQGWLLGIRRDVQIFFDRVQGRDQFLFEVYARVAFNRWGDDVSAGIRNITV